MEAPIPAIAKRAPTSSKRQLVRTPVLQSFDSSPASIEAFKKRRQQAAAADDAPGMIVDGAEDIFGIRIEASSSSSSMERRERQGGGGRRRQQRLGLFGRPGTERTDWAAGDSTENQSELDWRPRGGEPSQAPHGWLRAAGDKRPLGEEMRLDDGVGSLEDTFDVADRSVAAVSDGDPFNNTGGKKRSGGSRERRTWSNSSSETEGTNREYPPSPKKSPVKRLLFGVPSAQQGHSLDLDSAYGSVNASQDDDDQEEDSFLGNMASGFMQRLARGRRMAADKQPKDECEDNQTGTMQQPFERAERPRAPRRSLMRRRRTTTVHEDPITSPKVDAGSRITKPDQKRVGSGSSLSSVEEAAVLSAVVSQGRPAIPQRKSLLERDDTPRKAEQKRVRVMQKQMWQACGKDMARWNRGDFSGGTVHGLAKSLEVSCRW